MARVAFKTDGFTFKFQSSADEPALARFAQRMAVTKFADWALQVDWSRQLAGAPDHDPFVIQRRRLLLSEGEEIRAFHNFFEHEIYLNGRSCPMTWIGGPLSEGIVNRRYAHCYRLLLQHSLQRQPVHLVMGGTPAFRNTLLRVGWKQAPGICRYLLPLRPAKALREMAWFQRTRARRFAARGLAWSGLATLLGHLVSGRKARAFRLPGYRAEVCDHFGSWADDIWRDVMPTYAAVTRRDAAVMNRLYRPGDPRFRRVLVLHHERPVGWFLCTTCLKPTAEMDLGFGGLRVGALVDLFGQMEHARPLLALAVDALRQDGVDLIHGQFTHQGWGQALRDVGFLGKQHAAPFSASPAAAHLVLTAERPLGSCHFTDGDCDGPYYVASEEQSLVRAA